MTGSHTQKKQMTPDIWIEEQFKTLCKKKKYIAVQISICQNKHCF